MRVRKRWAAPALLAIALAAAAQSATAQAPPVFTLEGESFLATRAAEANIGTIKIEAYCGSLTATRSTIKYTTTGVADGPLLGIGTYWEQGTATIGSRGLNGRPIVGFKARFTIDSWLGRVTGTKQLGPNSDGFGECVNGLGVGHREFEVLATYTAELSTAAGACTTDGETLVNLSENEELDSARFNEFFTDGGMPSVCVAECPLSADDDGDGLIDSRENALLTLLGNADSDRDGIKDGNDDANGNGEDDEDEDDDDGCPDKDSDGDGEDDEDEDDDEDD